ncbi:MAG: sigma-70 family RNA polymerase sigma factor [Firmicutes bacterium]|nr:sigma-70 family RNA polymerase sigma factor [[Eubacterium] siraeum]MCM1487171.1 sigma-70 family RNA polymerase sigma factor [Bacillota bacterium]
MAGARLKALLGLLPVDLGGNSDEGGTLMDKGAESYLKYLSGDDEGIAEIVSLYREKLIFFLNGIVNNIYAAEDLAEDTFFKLMVKKPKFTPRYSFKTWLFTVARNLALDYLRKNAKNDGVPFEDMENLPAEEKEFERNLIRDEDGIFLHKAMESLPPQYSQILHLVYFEDFTADEAAKVVKKTKRQTEMLLYRARAALKTRLEKEGFRYEN